MSGEQIEPTGDAMDQTKTYNLSHIELLIKIKYDFVGVSKITHWNYVVRKAYDDTFAR